MVTGSEMVECGSRDENLSFQKKWEFVVLNMDLFLVDLFLE